MAEAEQSLPKPYQLETRSPLEWLLQVRVWQQAVPRCPPVASLYAVSVDRVVWIGAFSSVSLFCLDAIVCMSYASLLTTHSGYSITVNNQSPLEYIYILKVY